MTGPLQGLKVLDFSTLLPGPFGTMMLADMGAEVTRVLAPGRKGARPGGPGGEPNSLDLTLNRSKRSIAINLKNAESREIVKRLVAANDVLTEQFRPGVMKRLGWDYDAARAVNEKIIYCSLTGYGQNGPMRDRAGHDLNYLSTSGMMSYTGRKESGPSPFAVQVADLSAGSYNLVVGVLAALYHRDRTGEGQYVDVAMFDGSVALNAIAGADYLTSGHVAQPEAEGLNGGTFYDVYRTKDGRYLSAGGLEPKFLSDFLKALGRSDLANPGDSMFTMQNIAESKTIVRELIEQKDLAEWTEIFARHDACVEPVLTLKEMVEHPQTEAREMIVEVDDNHGGKVRQIACPIKFSTAHPSYRHAGKREGGETGEILADLGFSEGEIATFKEQEVVAVPEAAPASTQ